MLTIVIFHTSCGFFSGFASQWLGNAWNVAIFFIIAGFFTKEDKLIEPRIFITGKLKGLYVPATIIYIIAVLLHNVFVCLGWYPLGELHPGNGQPFAYYGIKDTAVGCIKAICCAGSGELAMGAMWFLYTLIYAFVGISLLMWVLSQFIKDALVRRKALGIILLIMMIVSCVMTQNYGQTIKRVNITFTAMGLISLGWIINQKLKWAYDNNWVFVVCLLVFIQTVLLQHTSIAMANNHYQDVVTLCAGSSAAIYVWGYIAKRIKDTWCGRFLNLVGRDSFYVMALHPTGFFLCNSILVALGVFKSDSPHGMYTYNMNGNIGAFICYMVSGIVFPLLSIWLFRKMRFRICQK